MFKFLERMIRPLMPRVYSIEPLTIGLVLAGGKGLYDTYKGWKSKKRAKKRAKNLKNKYNQAGAEAKAIASEDLISKGDINVASNIASRDARVNMENYLNSIRGNLIAQGMGNSSISGLKGLDEIAKLEGGIADKKSLALIDAGMTNKTYADKYRMMAHNYRIQGKANAIALKTAGETYGENQMSEGIGSLSKFFMSPELQS